MSAEKFALMRDQLKPKTLADVKAANKAAMLDFEKLAQGMKQKTDREKVTAILSLLGFGIEDTAAVMAACKVDREARLYWVSRYDNEVEAI